MNSIKKIFSRLLPTPSRTFHAKINQLQAELEEMKATLEKVADIHVNQWGDAWSKDESYLLPEAPLSENTGHLQWVAYLSERYNKSGMRVLEIGSRVVTGANRRAFFSAAEYIGFDYHPGENVDVVGDAHKLSQYFDGKFDLIFTSAVFEHFAMPWMVSVEMAKLLKIGGMVYVESVFSFTLHELPWDFFRFSHMGYQSLSPPALGFECIESGYSNPIVGRFSGLADSYLKNLPIRGLYCHSAYLGKKIKDVQNFQWNDVQLQDVVGDTKYPC